MEIAPTTSPPSTPAERSGGFRRLVCLLLVAALHLAIVSPMMQAVTNPADEGAVLVYPELFLKGIIAHRDYESFYPPGNIWFLAGAYKLFGTNLFVERSVGTLYQLLIIAGIFMLFESRGAAVAIAGCLLSSIIMAKPGVTALAWNCGLAWAIWSVAIAARAGPSRARAIWTGIFAGLALTWRADLAPALFLGVGACCIRMKWRRNDYLWLCLAGAVMLIPLAIHAWIATPAAFFDNVFYTPVIRAHNGRGLPLNFSNAYIGEVYSLTIIGTVSALWGAWAARKDPHACPLLGGALLALGILPQAYQRLDLIHLSFVAAFAIPLLVLAGSWLSRHWTTPLFIAAAACLAMPQELHSIAIIHTRNLDACEIRNGNRLIYGSFPTEQAVVDFLHLYAKPGQTLFVGSKDLRYTICTDTVLYYLLPDLRPSTYFLEFNPLSANRKGSRLAADVAKADWVVLNSIWNISYEPNASGIPGPDAPNEVIRTRFKLLLSAPPFSVYRRIGS